jgi:hypothetical protein
MLINAFKNTGAPDEVYLYTHPDVNEYIDLQNLGEENCSTASFYEGKIVSLKKFDDTVNGIKEAGTTSYRDLPGNVHRDLMKRAIGQKLLEIGLQKKAHSEFYFPSGSSLAPKRIGVAYVNYVVSASICRINYNTYLVFDPHRTVTSDGKTFDKEFAKGNFSVLSQNPIKYHEFASVINTTKSLLGESFSIDFDGGSYSFTYADPIDANAVKITGSEPKVRFGTGKTHTFPAAGLKQNGPWDYNESEERPTKIKVGIIGEGFTIPLLRQVYLGVKSTNPYAFPGFEKVYKSKLEHNQEKGRLSVTEKEIQDCSNGHEVGELFRAKARELSVDCDVAIVELPDIALNFNDVDLRDYLKVVFWEEKLPTQIILKSTVTRYDDLIVDNLALGIYVSAGGRPWILDEPFENEAFIGISFGVSKDGHTLMGIVEVFDGYGMSISMNVSELKVVQEGEIEERDKHINREKFLEIIHNAIADYSNKYNGNHPKRIIVHKTTYFNEEESSILEGLSEYAVEMALVYVNSYGNGVHLLKNDFSAPPQRLTYWQCEERKAFLYTKGPDDRGRTIDPFLPTPMIVEVNRFTEGSSYTIHQACSDIVKLTKLNWNSVVSYEKEPVTISHSRKIVALLRAGLDLHNIPTDIRFFI